MNELKQTASQLLAAMLSNPHIYPKISDEGGYGQMEQKLMIIAVEMAESLTQHCQEAKEHTSASQSAEC